MDFSPFDGSFKSKKNISLRGNSRKQDKESLLKQAREKRRERQLDRQKKEASYIIQVSYLL